MALTKPAKEEVLRDAVLMRDSKPERKNETTGTWFTLENFLPMGCLCDDDIYGQDPDFFDAILTFVTAPDEPCSGLTGFTNGDTPVIGTIPSDKHTGIYKINGVGEARPEIAGVAACPNPVPLNGFMAIAADGTSTGVSLNKEEMMNKVLNMEPRIPPAPPPLEGATPMSEIIADIHLYNFNADNLNTDDKREDLEDHIKAVRSYPSLLVVTAVIAKLCRDVARGENRLASRTC